VPTPADFITAAQNADGGWGYKPGGMTFVEPTAAVLLALQSDDEKDARVQRARARLLALQRPDGGWGIAEPDDESGWMTAWAVLALADAEQGAARRGATWLLKTAGVRITDAGQVAHVKQELRIDPTITGWPWQAGDAAWIFPSALALLALDAVKERAHPRVEEGVRYLLDRAIVSGGWNIGNPFMVTGQVPPTVEGTALTLLSLHALGVENDAVARGREWLAQDGFTQTSFEWAWRAWCWSKTGGPVARAREAMLKLQRANGSWDDNPFTTAVALMGLR
jgi:hypothetical protein